MIPRFRELDPLRTALVGVAVLVALLLAAFSLPRLAIFAGPTYRADFGDGGGMQVGDQVWVSGATVGKVTAMKLVGDKVEVSFTADGVPLGRDSTAAIKTGTLLGKRYLGLVPGDGPPMHAGDLIPESRTTTPYNITQSIEDVTHQLHGIDKPQLAAALNAFSDAFQSTPTDFRATLVNVTALSRTIATRDDALRELLAHANAVSGVLADRTPQFESLITDGDALLTELQRRKQVIDDLFTSLNYVTEQARDFVSENDRTVGPVLDQLNEVLDILSRNNTNLAMAIQRLAKFVGGVGGGVAGSPRFNGELNLGTPGGIFNFTDLLRQMDDPQAPRVPNTPGLPGGLGTLPNPLAGRPSGAGADPRYWGNSQPTDPANRPLVPLLGGN